jgi:hypothetical protein
MDCERCSGQMTYENFYGWESTAVWFYPGWRCIHCGEVVDSVIYLNRRLNSQHFWTDEESKTKTPSLHVEKETPLQITGARKEEDRFALASVGSEAEDDF